MWKLTQLVEEKEKQEKAAAATTSKDAAGGEAGGSGNGEFTIARSNSKELAESRKKKSKDNVFRIGGANRQRGNQRNKVQSCELRVQADLAELDPDATPGVVVEWPDEKNLLNFTVDVTPADGLYQDAKFRFEVEVCLCGSFWRNDHDDGVVVVDQHHNDNE